MMPCFCVDFLAVCIYLFSWVNKITDVIMVDMTTDDDERCENEMMIDDDVKETLVSMIGYSTVLHSVLVYLDDRYHGS